MVNSSYINRILKSVSITVLDQDLFSTSPMLQMFTSVFIHHCCRISRILLNWLNEWNQTMNTFLYNVRVYLKNCFGGISTCGWNIFNDEEYVILEFFAFWLLKVQQYMSTMEKRRSFFCRTPHSWNYFE